MSERNYVQIISVLPITNEGSLSNIIFLYEPLFKRLGLVYVCKFGKKIKWFMTLLLRLPYYALGSISLSTSFSDELSLSGNFISNATSKSPFLDGSLGNGSP